jgi:hypothetical protein
VATKQASLWYFKDGDKYTLCNHARMDATPTKINGKPMDEEQELLLTEGDKIEMGLVVFVFTKED